jgi:hypothetical protein
MHPQFPGHVWHADLLPRFSTAYVRRSAGPPYRVRAFIIQDCILNLYTGEKYYIEERQRADQHPAWIDGAPMWVAASTDTTRHPVDTVYASWQEARGGWPLVGDTVVADTPNGVLMTKIVERTDQPTLFVCTGGLKLPIGCFRRPKEALNA